MEQQAPPFEAGKYKESIAHLTKIETIRIRWHCCRKLTRKKELSMKCMRLKRVSKYEHADN
jgi:hypothetical protein